MKLVILIKSGHTHSAAQSALNFALAALQQGHHINQVFFYQDGTYLANYLISPPQDEPNIYAQWVTLAQHHQLPLVACVAAAAKRGILSQTDAEYHHKDQINVTTPFSTAGLGQFIQAIAEADRVISFGN